MPSNECPRAKSDMTPCFLRDGDIVVVKNAFDKDICVGCEEFISRIKREQEREKKA